GHLDRHGLEAGEERRAADRTSAGAVSADGLRFVADANLTHLDARPELARELAHQLAEIDACFGGEIEDEARSVERLLDARELHREPPLADLQQGNAVRLTLAMLLLHPRDDVFVRRHADD